MPRAKEKLPVGGHSVWCSGAGKGVAIEIPIVSTVFPPLTGYQRLSHLVFVKYRLTLRIVSNTSASCGSASRSRLALFSES